MIVFSKPESIIDCDLVRAAQQGDVNAFNRLVLQHQDGVYNLARRVLEDEAAAVRAAHLASRRAQAELQRCRPRSWRAWLYRLAVKACAQAWAQLERRTGPARAAIPTGQPGELSLSGLPFDLRLVAALVDLEGLDYEEAAAALEVSTRMVRSRLAQARVQLSKY
jgi:RNA polymerase sigma-70 factor (ECF subfamily)